MAKKKLSDDQRKRREKELEDALNSFPEYLEDNVHGLKIILRNDRARSNQTRFEHIIRESHHLLPSDIQTVIKKLPIDAKFRKDRGRKKTYNYYIKRNRKTCEFIKVSVTIGKEIKNEAFITTIFITKSVK